MSQSSPDFDLGCRVETKDHDLKIPSKPLIHTKLHDDHSYTNRTSNPDDEITKSKRLKPLL